ncbi:hypothetical protein DFJ63DRAFT_333517 [Scheffersomyces coipomensis]|uniref:uncharacterized protein n=1 Tax=Scheffersomyces coipomensis TaxID=1788519 RepID=UPI00315DB358
MSIFSYFGSSKKTDNASKPPLPATQLQQQSHQHDLIGSGSANSDISTTLNQLTENQSSPLRIKTLEVSKPFHESVSQFIDLHENRSKTAVFVIDGEKDTQESIICTTNDADGGKTCLKLQKASVELFKTMQRLEYFCSLPDDIDATYFECRKIK